MCISNVLDELICDNSVDTRKQIFGMNIKDLIGETTEYDKKLAFEEKRPKSWK